VIYKRLGNWADFLTLVLSFWAAPKIIIFCPSVAAVRAMPHSFAARLPLLVSPVIAVDSRAALAPAPNRIARALSSQEQRYLAKTAVYT
jgi:hypothetical protein